MLRLALPQDVCLLCLPVMKNGESQAAYDAEMAPIEKKIQTKLVTQFDEIRLSIAMALSITHLAIEREQRCSGAEMRRWMPRIHGFEPLTKFHDLLKSNQVGHFVAVRGNVVRVSGVRQKVVKMKWQCSVCGLETEKMLEGGAYSTKGLRCADSECKGRSNTMVAQRREADTIDWQMVRLQEGNDDGDVADAGRTPRSVECDLHSDLCDGVVPGDTVTICGEFLCTVTFYANLAHSLTRSP